jgi:splicing factor 1
MQRITGSNNAPLGKRKTPANSAAPAAKRERWSSSRWGPPQLKLSFPGLPLMLPKGLTKSQVDAYTMRVRIEEISLRLRTDDIYPPADRPRFVCLKCNQNYRSPSPEPIYGTDGKRVNMRDQRFKKKLEDERHKLINICSVVLQGFQSPLDYKRPTRTSEKVYIPSRDYPEVNFIGLLIGMIILLFYCFFFRTKR